LWPTLLGELVRQVHPTHTVLFGQRRPEYYWSADETEWATDVLFRSPETLAGIYPSLLRHGISNLNCEDVLRFLGRPGTQEQYRAAHLQADLKRRHEGVRLKHQHNHNSIKMYDKEGNLIRVETTINNARDIKVYRTSETDPEGEPGWLRLRKGVADLYRRAEVSQKANERYLEAMATVQVQQPLGETVRDICQPTTWQGRRVRGLAPFRTDDACLLEAVLRGEFALNGFRNRDLRSLLFGEPPADPREHKRQSAKVTRLIRLLRGHGLVQKITHTHRYQLTANGRTMITAILAAQHASTQQLAQMAA
jgi:hypothetical protein